MPYPEYTKEDVAFFISFISMFMILSFAIIIPPLIKRIVHEKESGIKVRYSVQLISSESTNNKIYPIKITLNNSNNLK